MKRRDGDSAKKPEIERTSVVISHFAIRIPKLQIPSTKLQVNLKFQYSMTKHIYNFLFKDDVNVWNFEFRSLGFVCYLGFVICNFHRLPPLHSKNKDELNSHFEIYSLPAASCPLPAIFCSMPFQIRNSKLPKCFVPSLNFPLLALLPPQPTPPLPPTLPKWPYPLLFHLLGC